MESLSTIRKLWDHAQWADEKLLDAIRKAERGTVEALREYAHIVGTYEVWLARLQNRTPRSAVWPEGSLTAIETLWSETKSAYGQYLSGLRPTDLDRSVSYANSAGDRFENSVSDILVHVALHGQYHRGKVNLLLRQSSAEPSPSDYIAFVRGAPAATQATSRPKPPSR